MIGFFSDAIGRKKTVVLSIFTSILGIAFISAFSNIVLKCIGLLLWGVGSDITFPVAATYISEIVAEEDRPRAYTMLRLVFSAGVLIVPIIFFLVKNWFFVLIFLFGLGFLVAAIGFQIFVESPPL